MRLVRTSAAIVTLLSVCSVARAQTANTQTDARDYEVLAYLPNNTLAAIGYFRSIGTSPTSSPAQASISQSVGVFRASYVLKFGNLAVVPFDATLPIVDVTVYVPNMPPAPTNLTLHTSGVADATYLPTIAYVIHEDDEQEMHTVVGATAYITAPTGNNQSSNPVNIGDNRWRIQPNLAISQRFAKHFTLDLIGNVALYTSNTQFGAVIMGTPTLQTLQQDPTFGFEFHAAADLSKTFWAAASYYVQAAGRRAFEVVLNGVDQGTAVTTGAQETVQTLRFTYGIHIEKNSLLLLQYNQDIEESGGAPIQRFFGARFSHVMFF